MTASSNTAKNSVYSEERDCLTSVLVERDDVVHLHVSALPAPEMDFAALCQALANYLHQKSAAIISMDVFGVDLSERSCLEAAFGRVDWPVTWVEGIGPMPTPLWGAQVWAVAGPAVTPITVSGRVVGSVVETRNMRYCRLGGVLPADASVSREAQAQSVFEQLSAGLVAADMCFDDVLRTWFYNRDMLEWYDAFNAVRTAFFETHNVFAGRVPASTGIGARCGDAALTAGLLAFDGDDATTRASVIPSPMQCPALDYGSSFSRAMELHDGALRWLLVSGTASIAREGESVHFGDVEKQIGLTMEVVAAILALRRMNWRHVSRAIAYFKHREHADALDRWFERHGVAPFPRILANTDICRDDLLFEIELDAIDTA